MISKLKVINALIMCVYCLTVFFHTHCIRNLWNQICWHTLCFFYINARNQRRINGFGKQVFKVTTIFIEVFIPGGSHSQIQIAVCTPLQPISVFHTCMTVNLYPQVSVQNFSTYFLKSKRDIVFKMMSSS